MAGNHLAKLKRGISVRCASRTEESSSGGFGFTVTDLKTHICNRRLWGIEARRSPDLVTRRIVRPSVADRGTLFLHYASFSSRDIRCGCCQRLNKNPFAMTLQPFGDDALDHKLQLARRSAPQGSVGDIQRKHLLSLVIRKAPAPWEIVPRSYVIPSEIGPAQSEYESFRADYELSRSLALVAHELAVRHQNKASKERATEASPSEEDESSLENALRQCERLLRSQLSERDCDLLIGARG
eukprot:558233-Rhodomonas_salina.1